MTCSVAEKSAGGTIAKQVEFLLLWFHLIHGLRINPVLVKNMNINYFSCVIQ